MIAPRKIGPIIESLLRYYLRVLDDQVISPARHELEGERSKTLAELQSLEQHPLERGGSEDREIMRSALRLRLSRIDRNVQRLQAERMAFKAYAKQCQAEAIGGSDDEPWRNS